MTLKSFQKLKTKIKMNVLFVNDCAVDGCYKLNVGKGKQMCKEHQEAYERGDKLKAFYGKIVQNKNVNSEHVGTTDR